MTGSDWLAMCPDDADEHIMSAAKDGTLVCDWGSVVSVDRGRRATIPVTKDALYVVLDDGSRYRPMVSAALQQRLADHFGGYLLTSKVSDLAYDQSKRLDAPTILDLANMAKVSCSVRWNKMVEEQRNGFDGLWFGFSKNWILSNLLTSRRDVACNYGCYSSKAPSIGHSGDRMWQTKGSRHNAQHYDYSQTCHLMGGVAVVFDEGVPMDRMLTEPNFYELVSDEGPLKVTRQP